MKLAKPPGWKWNPAPVADKLDDEAVVRLLWDARHSDNIRAFVRGMSERGIYIVKMKQGATNATSSDAS